MNFFQISIFTAFAGNAFFGFLVIYTHHRRLANQGFAVLTAVLGGWLLAMGFGSVATSVESVEFWIRQTTIASALIPVALNLLRLTLVHGADSWRSLIRKSLPWMAPYPFIVLLCQTSFFLKSAVLPEGARTVAQPVYGPGILIFALYMITTVVILVVHYVLDIRRSQGIQRTELQFSLIACILGFLTGVVLHIVSNITGVIEIGQLLPVPVIVMDAVMAYGIATKNIIDAPAFLRRVLGSSLVVLYVSIVYTVVYYVSHAFLPSAMTERFPLDHLLPAIVVVFVISPAYSTFHRLSGRIFPGVSGINVMGIMQRASRSLSSVTTLNELITLFSDLVDNLLGPEKTVMLMYENHQYVQRDPDSSIADKNIVLNEDDPIVVALQLTRQCLSADMLARSGSEPSLQQAGSRLNKLGMKIAVGVWSKNELQEIVLLGPRISGRIYGALEQQAIEGLCGQLAIAIENARLYTEVQNSRIYNDILLDRLVGGVIAVNNARHVTVFNREAQRITGLSQEKVIDEDMSVLPDPLCKGLEQAFTQGGNRHVETVLVSEGDEVPIQYGCTLFHGHTGEILGALMVFSDQTEIKKLQYQIRRTDRLASLGTLAAGMAHEIKNPLVSLKTFSQLLPERYEDPDFRETFSVLLGDEVHRIDRIVNQLLRFARPAKPSLSPINLHTVADNTLTLVKQQMRKHNIGVVRKYNAASDSIMGDGDMLTQAMLNFLLNAIDAMGESGEMILETAIISENTNQLDLWGRTIQTQRVRLSIIDNGKGIEEEDLLHVFDPFFTTKASGTGLGLSVSHGIIQEHNGAIDVESDPGKGTTLHLTFPLISEEANIEP